MQTKHILDIKLTARRYGKWAREGVGINYPAIQPFLRKATPDHGILMLDDETAMRIHDATLIMRNVTPELYQVFMLRYVSNLSQGNVGREMGVSVPTIKSYLYAAHQSLKLLLTQNKCIFLA
ncbi:RNA polymerase subunit sigma-70 [Haemophilus influenzae]|uniref:RNA polymerase sigma factor n=1 Tax=Haemophilus influenzae TaxID=727 RepID=UPI000DA3F81B|nr:antiterminator Q family protein [Haemophilus influenzae]MCK8804899.1 RNA polymerase subunit sigma-70 [Haemophilus influenzae]MCK8924382.1 RNA polymerase subunit sigma-70 [Haemophilus influenzae]MCK8972364.1 RNA polymerase subunit sigma-70 [Haemophilus influenzae]MCK8986337.1 RNA polymerase subunit sigma-70 [Haemophilus influenzae]MDF3109948.1 antiterminator Q family protein [Haemophilus influenzae]